MRSKILTISGCAILLALVGCTNDKVNVGDDAPVRTGASLSDYEGTWEGYVEAHTWPDGTDAIRIQLDANGNGVLSFGEPSSQPPPAIDPDVPPGYSADNFGAIGAVIEELIPGFDFPVMDATVDTARIRISTVVGENYRAWCEAQTPHLDTTNTSGGPHYACLPNNGWMGDANNLCTPLDENGPTGDPAFPCAKLACLHTCQCDAEGCTLMNDIAQRVIDAELTMEGEELDGTLVHHGRNFNIRMTRAN